MLTPTQAEIHNRAVSLARRYRILEIKLIDALQEVEDSKLYRKLDCPSLFTYATRILGLSEAVAYSFISVARKSKQFPELKVAIASHSLTVSKASRIVSSLNSINVTGWIEFAREHTSKEIDFEVARQNPAAQIAKDKVKPLTEDHVQITITISKSAYQDLKRAQAVLAQKDKNRSLGDVCAVALSEYLKREDPVQKANRAVQRQSLRAAEKFKDRSVKTAASLPNADKTKPELCANRVKTDLPESPVKKGIYTTGGAPNRDRLTAAQKNSVFARDQGRCTHINHKGERCDQDRWLDTHHIIPRGQGGSNDPQNRTTLCSFHHDLAHQLTLPIEGQITWLRSPQRGYGS